jgi:hypothetical protein
MTKKKIRSSNKSFVENGKETRTHHENISVAAYCCWQAVVLGGRQNSVCGLSFGRSHGRTIADDSKKVLHKSFIKNGKETRTHHKNMPATAYCCWQGGGVGREAKLSLWAEFRPSHGRTIADDFKIFLDVTINHS